MIIKSSQPVSTFEFKTKRIQMLLCHAQFDWQKSLEKHVLVVTLIICKKSGYCAINV